MKKTVNVHFVLDKSGSMISVKSSTISGFNEYLGTLQRDKKSDYKFSLTLFDTVFSNKYINEPIKKVSELTDESYHPDGSTALYDAVCSTLNKVKADKGKNLVVIMTDGQENASSEYTEKEFRAVVDELKAKKNWTFVFLGANQDSWANASKWGFNQGNVANYTATSAGTRGAFSVMASATMNYASMDTSTTASFYSAEDKEKLESSK